MQQQDSLLGNDVLLSINEPEEKQDEMEVYMSGQLGAIKTRHR